MNIDFNPEDKKNNIEQERKPLAVYPIFRENDLYCAMFPEIKPLFKKGEEPSGQAVLDEIKKIAETGQYREIAMDKTSYDAFINGMYLDKAGDAANLLFEEPLEEKFKSFSFGFSPKTVQMLLEIAYKKNPNIKRIILITEDLGDHTNGLHRLDVAKILEEEIKKTPGIEVIQKNFTRTFDQNIDESDHVIADRHAAKDLDLTETHPNQISLLPLESELHHNQEKLGKQFGAESIAELLRKPFEVTT